MIAAIESDAASPADNSLRRQVKRHAYQIFPRPNAQTARFDKLSPALKSSSPLAATLVADLFLTPVRQ